MHCMAIERRVRADSDSSSLRCRCELPRLIMIKSIPGALVRVSSLSSVIQRLANHIPIAAKNLASVGGASFFAAAIVVVVTIDTGDPGRAGKVSLASVDAFASYTRFFRPARNPPFFSTLSPSDLSLSLSLGFILMFCAPPASLSASSAESPTR